LRQTCLRGALVLSISGSVFAGTAAAQASPGYSPVVDFNGDGYADIGEHATSNGNFYVRLNNANGTFQPAGSNWTTGTTSSPAPTWAVLLGDFNTISPYADYIEIYRPTGQGWMHSGSATGFNPAGLLQPGTVSTSANVELIVAPRRFQPSWVFEHDRVTGSLFARQDNLLPLGASNFVTQTGSAWRIAMCDVNNDFRSDLIEYHIPSAQFWVHYADPFSTNFSIPANVFATAFSHPSFTTVFGDYNADGYCDYADVNKGTGEFWVHLNTGSGTFNPANYAYGVYTPNVGFSIMGLPVTLP
jgi:hypothetical protein